MIVLGGGVVGVNLFFDWMEIVFIRIIFYYFINVIIENIFV